MSKFCLNSVVSKQTGSQAGFTHFSPRSRDQAKAQVLMYHHLLPSPAPSLVSKAASTKSAACCRCSAAWNMESFLYRQLGRRAASQGWISLEELELKT